MKKRSGRPRASRPPRANLPEDLFYKAFQHSPAMQSVLRSTDGILVEVNDTFLKKLGFTREEVVGHSPQELDFWVHPEKLTAFRAELAANGFVQGREVELRARDGGLLTVLLSTHPIDIDGVRHFLSAGVDITARKRTEAELEITHERLGQSEERFTKAFRLSPAMMAITRLADGRFTSVNAAFLRAIGYKEDEVVGRTGAELRIHATPERRETFLHGIETQGVMRDYEFVIRAKDGQLRTLLASGERTIIDGEPHLLSVAQDITERKEAEAKLRESERRLRESEALLSAAFDASPVLLTIAPLANARFVRVNEAFIRHSGYALEEILGRNTKELGLWVDLEERAKFFERLQRERVVRGFDCLIRRRNGDIRAMQLSGAITDINGEPHLVTFGLDVTLEKQAEQGLRENEARVRALYESLSAAAMVHDENGFMQVNTAAVRLFGADRPEQIVGLHPGQVSPPIQPDGESSFVKAQRHMSRAMAEGSHRFDWTCRKLDGTDFPVEVTLTALQLGGRRVMQAVVLDLTERRHAEEELQRTLAKERELNQLKSDFVSLVSHEFRTPLEVIMSSADNLDRYHDRLPGEKRTHLLRTIHKSVARMSDMMEEVLLLGRLESGGTQFHPTSVDLASFCQRLCDEMESATNARCPIKLRLEDGTSSAGGCGDEAVLRHIFTNLLSNAVKYSEPGRTVEFVVRRDGESVTFEIVDHGCGIPAADKARLFQAFHRGSNVRHVPGTGLGLVIVQRSVALHGGAITVESEEGKGTTFKVRLPLLVKGEIR